MKTDFIDIELINSISNDNVNTYIIKDLKSNKEHTVKNVGFLLNKENLLCYMEYCYLNYNKEVKGFSKYLEFENEELNPFSLKKYKILNYVGLVYSKLI